ncbi:MAG TPA: alpha/beta hydrolase domain-containing protein [Bryobacteraceae bacterium]|nr:alpha/beta hydrolase domain-containing protein [Bryobacteraceae bacterium]
MRGTTRAVFALLLICGCLSAEVTRVEISKREDVLGGKSFGPVGAYEKLSGKVYFAVAPENPHNKVIVDVEKAPRNAQGKVEFSSDFFIIRPKDPAKSNGVVFFDIVNRGNLQLLSTFNHAPGSANPSKESDFGDGLLMREGFTLVAVGWQFDVAMLQGGRGKIGFYPPIAKDNGKTITGWVTPWFIPNQKADSYEYASGYFSPAYPPIDPKDPNYRLTEREGWVAAPRLIPRGDWQFGKIENGQANGDLNWITLKGGFRAGQTYQLSYEAKDPPVEGLGFAAVRDMAAAVKNDPNAIVRGKYAYAYGASQTGRWLRQMIYEGFTIDEQGRQAMDGIFIQTGATGLGSFNERFAQPNELGSFTQTKFPIRYETLVDAVTGKKDGLGARIPKGLEPKIMEVDTGSEYWDRGRVAALRHVSMDGSEDLADPPNVRVYTLAGTQHGSSSWPPAQTGGQLPGNPNDYRWAQQGLVIALDRWVRQGVEPPASRHPRLSDATLIAQSRISYPAVPHVKWPLRVPGGFRIDLPGPVSALPFLVPQVDADGNDEAGIRLPEQAVPLGTYNDWTFRSEKIGAPETLIAMIGSYIPFAKTKAEREKNGDPRLSIEERYASREDYLKKVEAAANDLVKGRYLLAEHVKAIVERAGEHWDWQMAQAGASLGTR